MAKHGLGVLYVVLMMLGLRKGEVLGLQWFDLELDAATLHVRRQVQTINNKEVHDTQNERYCSRNCSRETLPPAFYLEPVVGLEPTTYCLQDSCSTN